LGRVAAGISQLQLAEQVVAQVQRLGQAAEPVRMVGDPGDREQLVDAAHAEYQPVVGHGRAVTFRVDQLDLPGVEVDPIRRAEHQPDPGAGGGQRHRHPARLQDPAATSGSSGTHRK
jgi:hypothetical protein